MRYRQAALFALLFLLAILWAGPAAGQTAAEPAAESETPGTTEPVAATEDPESSALNAAVLERLETVLRAHPRELTSLIRRDPTLLANPGFTSAYPELGALVTRHPEVSANPRLYVEHVGLPQYNDYQPSSAEQFFEAISIVGVMLILVFAFIWLIKTIVEERRWSRLTRIQSETHAKLLDRLTSSEDMLAYMQSPSGRRFLESTPIPLQPESRPAGAPTGRMLWAIQIGIVVAAGAIGLLLVSGGFAEGGRELSALGVVGLSIGVGFVVSGVASFILSRRLGMLGERAQAD